MPVTKRRTRTVTTHKRIRVSVALLLSGVLILSLFPPFELIDYVYWGFTLYFNVAPEVFIMMSDLLLLLAGFLLAYSVEPFLLRRVKQSEVSDTFQAKRWRTLSLVAAALIIVYWHVPTVMDSALLSFPLHVIMHLSLLLTGCLIFVGSKLLTDRSRKIMSILGCKAMGIFGVFLLVKSGTGYSRFYSVYPLSQQAQFGLSMMIMMFVFEGFLVPYWLYQYFNKSGM